MIPLLLSRNISISQTTVSFSCSTLQAGFRTCYSGTVKDKSFSEAIYLLLGRISSVSSHFLIAFELAKDQFWWDLKGIITRGHCDRTPKEGLRGPQIRDGGTFFTFSDSFYKTTNSSPPTPIKNPLTRHILQGGIISSIPVTKLETKQ